jgi:tetratricopeptide (TPR) repeat protein
MQSDATSRSAAQSAISLLLLAFLLLSPMAVSAVEDPRSIFDQGNRFYERGEYAAAVAAYRSVLERNQTSAALLFNLANAHFKLGETGQAIACYRMAGTLSPRDADIRANLRHARESVGLGNSTRWQRWLEVFTVNEITLIAAGAVWLWCIVAALGQLRRQWRPILRRYLVPLGVLAAAALIVLGIIFQHRLGSLSAVVIADAVTLRYGPFEESQSFFTLPDGAELTVLDRKGDWLQVRDSANRTGWLMDRQVILLPPG